MLVSHWRFGALKKPLLSIEQLVVIYPGVRGRARPAVSDVSLQIQKGESLGLVGESGCGKSSVAKAVMQFIKPASGQIRIGGNTLTGLDRSRLRRLRPGFQMIFQDSISALNPRRSIGDSIAMPLKLLEVLSKVEREDCARQMMQQVGLDPSLFDLLPHQLSGGQCQRVQMARGLITQPKLLICDEPVSALDVSVQAQIINLLEKLRRKTGLTLLFISHDLAVVKNVCDRIAVMYAGKICEIADSNELYRKPHHPYSKILIEAIPSIGQFRHINGGNTPKVHTTDSRGHGCKFRRRCFQTKKRCGDEEPVVKQTGPGRYAACHYPLAVSSF